MNPFMKKTPDASNSKRASLGRGETAAKLSEALGRRKRKSERHIVPLDRQSCKLKVGDRVLTASLVNESQGGFAVWTDRLDDLKIGETLQLQTDRACFTVRVIYTKEVAKFRDACPKCDDWFQLGFKKANGFLSFLDTETLFRRRRTKAVKSDAAESRPLRTKKKIEAAIAEEIGHLEQEYMGQKPKHIYVCLLGNLLVVRLRSVLAEVKEHLGKRLPFEEQSGLLKEVRSQLFKTIRPSVELMVEKITSVKVLTTQHSVNETTGEEVLVFTLAQSPAYIE
jgi:uncharacterized protein YbcI